ncbi:hypothetical protein Tco_0909226 [Tanacetum coccineum]|uniref:Uncharacterized protein n=1 Tax=Tanacetum coccineum TaxID=301880 RepID=A0ABQ5CSV0_9ASTR
MKRIEKRTTAYHDLVLLERCKPKPSRVRRIIPGQRLMKHPSLPRKRVKATAKVAKSGKKKQPALGLETPSDIESYYIAEQMKTGALKEAKHKLHISQPTVPGVHRNLFTPGVPDVPTYESNDEKISWKSSEEEDNDEENVSEHEDDDELN